MHMSDCLISPAVGVAMFAASTAAITYATVKLKKDGINLKKTAIALSAGAAIFSAQAVNYAIPGTGSSGHILGAVMLAALVGAAPAMIVMAAVLTLQCFLLGDGGMLALGANIFNVGVIPCLIVYPLVFKPFVRKSASMGRTALASMAAGIVSLQIGAFGVVLVTQASGITALPFADFAAAMLPIHLAIGLVEGAATAAVLCLVLKASPEIMSGALDNGAILTVPVKRVIAAFAVIALFVGLALPPFASSAPDGLEWSVERVAESAAVGANEPVIDG